MDARRDFDAGERGPEASPWSVADWLLLTGITVFGAVLRLVRLAYPRELVFDETYYAKDACWYFEASAKVCDGPQTEAHPPLGKWLIGSGIELFGFDPFGWRIVPAIAGILIIPIVYILMRRLTGSVLAAALGAGFLAIDLLHVVQSRISMLDIFLPLFAVTAVLFVVLDRDASPGGIRPWRMAAGIIAGAAVATKWSGVLVLVTVMVLSLVWSLRRTTDGVGRRSPIGMGSFLVSFVLMPALVYLVSYAGRLDGQILALPWAEGSWLRALLDQQEQMFSYHRGLQETHSYQSAPQMWLVLKRPVAYFFETADNDDYREILATGNPFVWWPSVVALMYVAVDWFTAPGRRPASGVILAGFGLAYLPWLLLGLFSDRTATFLFYLLPAVPFMCMALGYVAWRVAEFWEGRIAIAVFGAAAIASFVFYRPLLVADPLPYAEWRQRLCLAPEGSDRCLFAHPASCEKPEGKEETITTTVTTGARTSVSTSTANTNASLPPKGWCWI